MLMPLLPAAVVVIGFHGWRRLCPVATLGSIGTRSWRGRRLPAALRNEFFAIPFALLVGALVLRHVWMNGDGVALALFLAGFVLAAFAVNAVFGGKTWCNYFCPVGFIERVYTDAVPVLRRRFTAGEQTIVLPGGPTIPALALLLCLAFLASATVGNLIAGAIGLAVGMGIYFRRRAPEGSSGPDAAG
jgi:polyferredoxin